MVVATDCLAACSFLSCIPLSRTAVYNTAARAHLVSLTCALLLALPSSGRRSTFQTFATFDVSTCHTVPAGSSHVSVTTGFAHTTAEMEKNHYGDPPAQYPMGDHGKGRPLSVHDDDVAIVMSDQNELKKDLKGRHMQMIAMSVFME